MHLPDSELNIGRGSKNKRKSGKNKKQDDLNESENEPSFIGTK